jgi:hypothetical protein
MSSKIAITLVRPQQKLKAHGIAAATDDRDKKRNNKKWKMRWKLYQIRIRAGLVFQDSPVSQVYLSVVAYLVLALFIHLLQFPAWLQEHHPRHCPSLCLA